MSCFLPTFFSIFSKLSTLITRFSLPIFFVLQFVQFSFFIVYCVIIIIVGKNCTENMFMLFEHFSNSNKRRERESKRKANKTRGFSFVFFFSLLNFAQTFKLLKLQFKLDMRKRAVIIITAAANWNKLKKGHAAALNLSYSNGFVGLLLSFCLANFHHFEMIKFSQ